MGMPGPLEMILIFLVVLLIFGANKIPEIARGIGKGIREFKDATSEISKELDMENQRRQIDQPQAPQQGAPTPRNTAQQQNPAPQQNQPQQNQQQNQQQAAGDQQQTSANPQEQQSS